MGLTSREQGALHRIETMYKNGFSLEKIKSKLEPRYTSGERKRALEAFFFKNVKL